jgi:hypothetical protein
MTRNTLDSLLVTLDPTAAAAAASAAILRLSGLAAGDIDVVILSEPNDPTDRFRAVVSNGILRIEASSARAAVSAYARYVRSTGEAHVARFGTRQPDGTLEDGEVLEGRASLDHRVAYNFTVSGYTTPYFNWAQWEQEIDLLAASGVTSAHITLGQEVVWLRTFTQFGYSQEEILRWICPPSHQPWQWLNNIQNFGEGTTLELIERRVELARRVIGRLRELGITPILPGFSGTVPQQFAERNADSPTVPQGKWFMDLVGPERPDWLSTTTEGYAAVSRVFYNEQFAAFGVSGVWAIDLLHEGGKTGSFEIGAAARGVEAALAAANPDYTWVIQAWAGNPRKQLLEAIDLSKVIILDLTGEAAAQLDSFDGSDWALGILPNYGGRTVLYGDLVAIAELPGQWSGAAELSGLRGLTNMAEGVGNNPVVWDLFSDLAWEHQEVDLPGWLEEWLRSRYGAHNQNAIDAWGDLLGSVYGPWRHDGSAATPFESSQALQGSSVDAGMSLQARGRSDIQPLADAEAEFGAFGFYASTDSVIGSIPIVCTPIRRAQWGHVRSAMTQPLWSLLSVGCWPRQPKSQHRDSIMISLISLGSWRTTWRGMRLGR